MNQRLRLLGLVTSLALLGATNARAANYPLEITQPQPNLDTQSRYYKAHPGVPYEVPIGVFGGLYPFVYELTSATTCGGSIDGFTGILTWDAPAEADSGCTYEVQVTDDEGTTDTVSWTVTVTTAGFVFVDDDAGPGGDGSIGSPLTELADVWGSDGSLSTYDDHFLYLREGTYGLTGGSWSNCPGQQCKTQLNVNLHPHVWLAYPGEEAVIDHDLASGSNGAYIDLPNGCTDVYIAGIRFQDMLNHALRMGGSCPRIVLYGNTFFNGGPGIDGHNSSFVMFTGTEVGPPSYQLVKSNVFDTADTWAFLKSYSTNKAVHEANVYRNPIGMTEGLAIKAYDQQVSIRANTFDGDFTAGSISGNWNHVADLDISFNNLIHAASDYDAQIYGALTVNHDDTAGPAYIYRNTFAGTVTVRYASSSVGPFVFANNVIVNKNEGTPAGSHITHYSVDEPSRVVLSPAPDEDLVGYGADGIIDDNGLLIGSYTQYIGIKGHQLPEGVGGTGGGGGGTGGEAGSVGGGGAGHGGDGGSGDSSLDGGSDDEGCGCTVVGRARHADLSAGLMVMVGLMLRRRRRQG